MFIITNKLRTLIAIGTAVTALAGSGVAAAQPIDPSKVGASGAIGPQGRIYSNQDCENLANTHNINEQAAQDAAEVGNQVNAQAAATAAANDQTELESNCIVID